MRDWRKAAKDVGGAGPAAFAGEVVPNGGAASREDGGVLCDLGTQPSGLCIAYLEVDRFFGGAVAGGGVSGGGAEAVGGGGGALGVRRHPWLGPSPTGGCGKGSIAPDHTRRQGS